VFRVTRNHSGNPELLAPFGGKQPPKSVAFRSINGRFKSCIGSFVPNTKSEMEKEKKTSNKSRKGGRPLEDDPATNCVMVRFNNLENAQFMTLFEQSGMHTKAHFIKARVFDQTFRVVKTDRAALEYVTKLTSFYSQYRAIGVNYNQVVKELHSHFSEKKTLALLYKLESITKELVALSEQIGRLSQEFQTKFLNPVNQKPHELSIEK
jgi:hypothetical protein